MLAYLAWIAFGTIASPGSEVLATRLDCEEALRHLAPVPLGESVSEIRELLAAGEGDEAYRKTPRPHGQVPAWHSSTWPAPSAEVARLPWS